MTPTPPPAYDLAPLLAIAAGAMAIALAPLAWFWARRRQAPPVARLRALALLTLLLSFDLVLLGAFTRLSDSGLGCPDWPGCYGHATPIGAGAHIALAQAATPTGPVTHTKAWIEMAHRYAASAIGVLVIALVVLTLHERRRGRLDAGSLGWAVATLAWILAQGAFGALTVTMKLYPAIVTLHLLGGIGLLVLLAIQTERYAPRTIALSPALRRGLVAVSLMVLVQIALGGWVSTNYAVLACTEFPGCQGSWWPQMRFADAFDVLRPLGGDGAGGYLPFAALTAIHMAHRLAAFVVVPAVLVLAWHLGRAGSDAAHDGDDGGIRPWAWALAGVVVWQAATGLGNVLLGWPLLAAVGHTGGSAALAVVLTVLLVRSRVDRPAAVLSWTAGRKPVAS